jgi:uncharacterized membrane protein YsdA (DUF1294 family)
MQIVIGYIIILNIVTFAVYGIDKIKAKKGAWRIPEKSLLLLAFIGVDLFNKKSKYKSVILKIFRRFNRFQSFLLIRASRLMDMKLG